MQSVEDGDIDDTEIPKSGDRHFTDASSKSNGLPNIPKSRDLIQIYSLVGLFALIYALTQFK